MIILSISMSVLRKIIILAVLFTSVWMLFTNHHVLRYKNTSHTIDLETFDLINSERAGMGIPQIIWNDEMARQAQEYSVTMASINYLVHSDMGYDENIARGYTSSADTLYQAWKDSPRHRANYLNSTHAKGAVGIGYKLYQVSIGSWTITYNISQGFATFIATSRK